jgi:hypothetical protein
MPILLLSTVRSSMVFVMVTFRFLFGHFAFCDLLLHRNEAVWAYGDGVDTLVYQKFSKLRVVAWSLSIESNMTAGFASANNYCRNHLLD